MQGAVSEGCKVDEGGLPIGRLQGQGEIDGHGGGSAAAFGVDDREHFSSRTFLLTAALGGGESNKGFEKVGGGGGAFNEFAGPVTHGADYDLRLAEASDGEDSRLREFLAKKFDGAHRDHMAVGGDIHQKDVGIGGLYAAHDGIGGSHGESGAGMNRAGDAGAVDQHLEHGALFIVGGHDDHGKLGHASPTTQLFLRRVGVLFRPSGARSRSLFYPLACAAGCILAPPPRLNLADSYLAGGLAPPLVPSNLSLLMKG